MVRTTRPGVTLLLGRARAGDERARGELIALIYDELRRVASGADAARAARPHPLAHRGGPRGRDPAAGRVGLRQGGGPELPVRLGGAGHAGGAHRPCAAAGRRPPRRGQAARPARRGGGLLRGAGAGPRRGPRGARPAGRAGRAAGPGHDPAILRRHDRSRGRRGARGLGGARSSGTGGSRGPGSSGQLRGEGVG